MPTIIELARELLAKSDGLSREEERNLWTKTPPEVRKEAYRLRKESFFVEKNLIPEERSEYLSPTGTYKMVIDRYTTREGNWDYSRGRVYQGDDLIADVKRNYPQFPFSWVCHPDGNTYLYCGSDYQGQTFINLRTGERRDTMSEGSEEGWGFCWAAHHPAPRGSTYFAVEGCYWGAPYEVWAFDITDPMHPKPVFKVNGDFEGWTSQNSFVVSHIGYEAVNLPGHPLHGKPEYQLSPEELEEVSREARRRGFNPEKDEWDLWEQKFDETRVITLPDDVNVGRGET